MCGLFVKLTMPAMKSLPRQLKTRHILTYVNLTILTWWPGKYAWPQYFHAGTGVIHVCLAVPACCPQHSYYGQKPQQLCWAIDYDYSCSLEECVWLPDQTLNTQTEVETYGRHCNRNLQGFFFSMVYFCINTELITWPQTETTTVSFIRINCTAKLHAH